MALIYERTSTRTMDPRPGVKYSTRYNRITASTRRRMRRELLEITDEIVDECERQSDFPIIDPLKGFPRTEGRANYSAVEIMSDLLNQLKDGKDVPDAMVYRWNKLFEEFPDIQIQLVDPQAQSNYNELFR